ncbi:MAG: magnesium-translocating P-type ATPase [Phenylobacterium sp.]|uniref:magnesium-translocating P-type ATPase n=1 Tax=Phenylobacterium sp. TaxID=1871053 RepID=UPI001217C111|nr:magnesium-translocating P-type ATPase [Phenylobacterium sp.]TAJ73924.1 MAG: magnesium-translocating P-type ATPase [Phenylobacterium sp.]
MTDAAGGQKPYWSRPVDELFRELASSPGGIPAVGAEERLRREGRNLVREEAAASAVGLLVRQFQSPLVLILVFAGVIAGALREWIDASIILAMVLGSTLLGFVQEYRASRAVAELRQRLALTARVRRDGRVEDMPFSDLVRGDVVLLSAGAVVPADAVVLSATDLLVSEAALTGESFPVEKRPGVCPAEAPLAGRSNCVFLGTSVRSGTGEVLIVATGRRTEFGEIAERLKQKPVETDFARGLRRFGYLLIRVMVGIVLFVLIVNQLLGRPFGESLLFAVALGLGMSPELLPAIVIVTLSTGATQLAKRGVIVRQLEAIENLGGMTVFCTDKTGTLTEGRIRMVDALDAEGRSSEAVRRLGFLNACFETGIDNPLDQAVLEDAEARALSPAGFQKSDEIPYDFTRKRLSVVIAVDDDPASRTMVTKGAFDHVIALCAAVAVGEGDAPLDAPAAARVRAFYKAQSEKGLRLLAVATRRLPIRANYGVEDEAAMRLEGFLAFRDPPKADASAAIAHLREMGVSIKVISGDNRYVLRHVAEAVGIQDAELITGAQLARLKDEALWNRAERATLFAEVDPQQKERIVRALQRRGHCVGYLGDGINDAPALYAADVGVSVDQAVDVARESADVVLLHRDLDVLREGVEGGRRTFANTLKYIRITTSANFGNMVSMALATPFLPFLPLAAKQILLNNFLSDLPAMAISSDAVDGDRLANPQRMSIGDLQRFMVLFGLTSSAFDLTAFAVLLYGFKATEPLFQTAWFVLSLLTELAALMSLRTQGPAWRSRPGKLLVGISLAVGVLALSLPFITPLAQVFGLTPLRAILLGVLVALVVSYLAATEAAKLWYFRRREQGQGRAAFA